MKVLIDECLPRQLKSYLSEFEVFTVSELGWESFKNGTLLKHAIDSHYDIFLTADKKLKYEQNMKLLNISIVIFDVYRNKIENILPMLDRFKSEIENYSKNEIHILKE